MIIDMHMHEMRYSGDSFLRLENMVEIAKRRDIYKNFSEVWTFAMKLRCNYDSCIVMSTNS